MLDTRHSGSVVLWSAWERAEVDSNHRLVAQVSGGEAGGATAWPETQRQRFGKECVREQDGLCTLATHADLRSHVDGVLQQALLVVTTDWISEAAKPLHCVPSRKRASSTSVMTHVDRAYENLDRLLAHQYAEGMNSELEEQLKQAWARLNELQEAARAEVRQELEASVELPLSELRSLLSQVEDELANNES